MPLIATPRRASRPPPRVRDRDRVVAGGDPLGGLDQAAEPEADDVQAMNAVSATPIVDGGDGRDDRIATRRRPRTP